MSSYLAIATVTSVLKKILTDSVGGEIPGVKITTQPPDTLTTISDDGLNIYLYQVTMNSGYNNMDLPTRNLSGDLVSQPRLGINLHYLLTVHTSNGDDLHTQKILASTMRTIHENPILDREIIRNTIISESELDRSTLAQQMELIKLSYQPLSLEEITKMWSSFFQTPYRISVAYQATVVLLESQKEPKAALPVNERMISVLPFRKPILHKIEPQIAERIHANTKITLVGTNLKNDNVTVKFDQQHEEKPSVASISNDKISINMPSVLSAGIKTVKVIHQFELGLPPTQHKGYESNIVAFVLVPKITSVADEAQPSTTVVSIVRDSILRIAFRPPVTPNQKVELLLGDHTFSIPWLNIEKPLFFWDNIPNNGDSNNKLKDFLREIFEMEWIDDDATITKNDDGSTIQISKDTNKISITLAKDITKAVLAIKTSTISNDNAYEFVVKKEADKLNIYEGSSLSVIPNNLNFPDGTFLIRLRVDGAESFLIVDEDPISPTYKKFVGPQIEVRPT